MNMYVKVIFKVQFSLSSLLSHYAVTSYAQALSLSKTFSSTAPNWVTQPAAYSQGHLRWSSEVPAHLCICLSLYLSVLVSFSLFLGAQWYIGRSTLTLKKSQWKRVLKESRRISVTFFLIFLVRKVCKTSKPVMLDIFYFHGFIQRPHFA